MEHEEAINILVQMLKKHTLTPEEQKALTTAIGVLGWSSLAKSRIKSIKNRRDKNNHSP